jgi:hypothetical protein
MIYYRGAYGDAVLVASDVEDQCPDLVVGLMPSTARAIEPDRHGEWTVCIALPEETPMLHMFSFTDDKQRTFEWGLEYVRDETVIICKVSQPYKTTIEVEGEKRIQGINVYGAGDGSTAQIAYDKALAELTKQMHIASAS